MNLIHNVFHRTQFRFLPWAILIACALASAGCSHGARDYTVDKQLAHESLVAFLDCWKQGQPASALKERSPSIIGRDDAWADGAKLLSYQIVGDDTDDGSNVFSNVELTVQGPRDQSKYTVAYVISTKPAITVFPKG